VLLAVMATGALAGCAVMKTSSLALTPVVSPPTDVHHPGAFVWHDLLTHDVPAARNFYSQVFGWSFEEHGRYTVVLNEGKPIAGIVALDPKQAQGSAARWLASLSVDDVADASEFVASQGGVVHEGPVYMIHRGVGALVSDPQGAHVLLLRSETGDPPDVEPAVGEWLWVELWSNVLDDSVLFYQKLVGYDVIDGEGYSILLREGHWLAGVRDVPDDELDIRWVPVVRVADATEVTKRAEKHGGLVLTEPRPTDLGNTVALVADPSGALVIVQTWSGAQADGQ
jgi:predicted enzyme related to lactoylglutathione lyase